MKNTFATHILGLAANSKATTAPAPAATGHVQTTHSTTSLANTSLPGTYATAVLLMAMGSTAASAATDGSIGKQGAGSTASTRISLVVPERIDARGLDNLNLQQATAGAFRGTASACISGHGSGSYHLSAMGSGPDGAFETTDGQNTLAYEVDYSADGGNFQPLTMGQALEHLSGAGAMGCKDNTINAQLALRMNEPAPGPADSTLPYRGALTLVIAPE